jgi:translation initiation factor IF-1
MRVAVLAGAFSMAFTVVASAQTYDQSVQVEMKAETIRGDVVRYVPGRMVVVRIEDGREVSYRLPQGLKVPANVKVGQKITLLTDRSADGSPTIVKRMTTTSGKPETITIREP